MEHGNDEHVTPTPNTYNSAYTNNETPVNQQQHPPARHLDSTIVRGAPTPLRRENFPPGETPSEGRGGSRSRHGSQPARGSTTSLLDRNLPFHHVEEIERSAPPTRRGSSQGHRSARAPSRAASVVHDLGGNEWAQEHHQHFDGPPHATYVAPPRRPNDLSKLRPAHAPRNSERRQSPVVVAGGAGGGGMEPPRTEWDHLDICNAIESRLRWEEMKSGKVPSDGHNAAFVASGGRAEGGGSKGAGGAGSWRRNEAGGASGAGGGAKPKRPDNPTDTSSVPDIGKTTTKPIDVTTVKNWQNWPPGVLEFIRKSDGAKMIKFRVAANACYKCFGTGHRGAECKYDGPEGRAREFGIHKIFL
ncbi:hypothetical protein P7C70_g8175, partial [Phenoliferia sp. Uapishka_3]